MKHLVVIAGPPCSGKSTLAAALAAQRRWTHLSMDGIRSIMLPWSGQSKADRRIAYQGMHALAEILLSRGKGVILDATYGPEEVRQDLSDLAARAGLDVYWIQCRVRPEVAVKRFLGRESGHPAVDLNESRVRKQALAYPYLPNGFTVDAESPVERLLPVIDQHFRQGRSLPPAALIASPIAHAV